jgi:hypothetical protein
MEYKNIKLKPEEVEGRTLVGYASAFGNKDRVGDTIIQGAFKKTLKERGDKVKVFYNHYQPLGIPIKILEDNTGLYTESKISKTTRGDEVLELIKDGVIDTMSIAYEVINATADKTGRILKELKLYEYGPVDMAANEDAVITGVKSLIEALKPTSISDKTVVELKTIILNLENIIGEPSKDTLEQSPLDSTIVDRLYKMQDSYFEQILNKIRS